MENGECLHRGSAGKVQEGEEDLAGGGGDFEEVGGSSEGNLGSDETRLERLVIRFGCYGG